MPLVTAVPDSTHTTVADLIGYGDDYFVGDVLYIQRDAGGAGAAPQSEKRYITDYTSTTGNLAHAAFSSAVGVDDAVIVIHGEREYNLDTIQANQAKELALIESVNVGVLADTAEKILAAVDAIGGTKKDVKVEVYIDAATVGNIEECWYLTSIAAPATFVKRFPINAAHNPGAAAVLQREFGDLPEGLRLEFRIDSAGDDDLVNFESVMSYLG